MNAYIRVLAVLLGLALLISASISVVSVVIAYHEANSLKITREAATRLDCRARIENNAADDFRHDIGGLLDGAFRRDQVTAQKFLVKIEHVEATNTTIKRECGAAAVAEPTTKP